MGGFLFHETVFGPVMSRRLGVSLGVNLLPVDYKYCTFNCIYCECGWTHEDHVGGKKLPDREEVKGLLEEKLIKMKDDGQAPDAITFAGNGEPTIHPEFPGIIDDTIDMRNKHFPETRVTVLSNASMLYRSEVFEALKAVDDNIQKLDAGTEEMFQMINKPSGKMNLENVVENLCRFNGNLVIQTLFLRGSINGQQVDNATAGEINSWIELLKLINPEYVMIYPIDRATPEGKLERISFDELSAIARQVNESGIKTKVCG